MNKTVTKGDATGLPRGASRLQLLCQNSKLTSDLCVAPFRVGSCDFVDRSFWGRKADDPRNHTNQHETKHEGEFEV